MVAVAVGVVLAVGALTAWAVASGGDDPGGGRRPGAPATVVGPGSLQVDTRVPDFDLPGLDGGRVRLSGLRGRPVVVNFWASWCNPCRREFPLLRDARRRHRAQGLEVVGITYQDIPSDSRRFARSRDARWPLAVDDGGAVARAYGVRAVPQTFFVRRDGTLATRTFGITSAAALEDDLSSIVGRP